MNFLVLDLQMFNEEGNTEGNIEDNTDGNTNSNNSPILNVEDNNKNSNDVTYTQEELERIIKERLSRVKPKNDDGAFEKLSEKERELQKSEQERKDLEERLDSLEKITIKSEVISQFAKNNLPCIDEFSEIVDLFTSIKGTEERVKAFSNFTNFINKVQQINKQDSLKKTMPVGSNGSTSNTINPFAEETINFTQAYALIQNNYEEAKELALSSNNFDAFKHSFNK